MMVRKILYQGLCLGHSFSQGGYSSTLFHNQCAPLESSGQMFLLVKSFLGLQSDFHLCLLYASEQQ